MVENATIYDVLLGGQFIGRIGGVVDYWRNTFMSRPEWELNGERTHTIPEMVYKSLRDYARGQWGSFQGVVGEPEVMNGGGGGDDENDEREKGGKWKSINHLSADEARKQLAKMKLMEAARADEDMNIWEEIRKERGGLVGGMEEFQGDMTKQEINDDIQSLEEMLPIEEGWLERQIINANSDSERIGVRQSSRGGRLYRFVKTRSQGMAHGRRG